MIGSRQWFTALASACWLLSFAASPAGAQKNGDYSVLVVANVDAITADATLEKLAAAGYGDFVKSGSAGEGFDVYMPGLSLEDARALAEEVKSTVGYARAWETDKLP